MEENNNAIWIIYILFCSLLVIGLTILMMKIRKRKITEGFEDQYQEDQVIEDEPLEENIDETVGDTGPMFMTNDASEDVSDMTFTQSDNLSSNVNIDTSSLVNVDDVTSLGSLPDPSVLVNFDDIPVEPVDPEITLTDFPLVIPEEPEDATNIGDPTWIYFVPNSRIADCDNNEYKRPAFWYNLSQNSQTKSRLGSSINNAIYTNCKYRIPEWRTSWQGDQKGYKITQETRSIRGNPLDWMRVIQKVVPGQPALRKDHPLLTNITTTSIDNDNYHEATVNTITGSEMHDKICRNAERPPVSLPLGTFLVLTGYPVRSWQLYVDNTVQNVNITNMWPFKNMFRETLTTNGNLETLSFVPKSTTLQAYVYMRDFCGRPHVYRQVSLSFGFTRQAVIKTTTINDFVTKGTIAQLQQRLPLYMTQRDNANRNYNTLQTQKSNAITNINNMYNQSKNGYPSQKNASLALINSEYTRRLGTQANYKKRVKQTRKQTYTTICTRVRWKKFRPVIERYKCTKTKNITSYVWQDDTAAYQKAKTTQDTWKRNQITALDNLYKKKDSDLETWKTNMLSSTNTSYNNLINAQRNLRDTYISYINRINAILDNITPLLINGINSLINNGHYRMQVLSADPKYKTIPDLYSVEDLDANGNMIPGTAKLYLRFA